MSMREFRTLQRLCTACNQALRFHCDTQRRSLHQLGSSTATEVISRQAFPFYAKWRLSLPQFEVSPANFKAYSVEAGTKDAAPSASGEGTPVKKKKRRKKTFLEVAQFLPNWGLGARFKKSHWPEGSFYKVTKVKVYKSGIRGAAWGIFHKEEAARTGEVQKIGGVNKRCWRYVPDVDASAIVWKRSTEERPVQTVPLTTADV